MSINIAIVEDHELFREGICGLLLKNNDFKIVGKYENGKVFLENLNLIHPDIVLMDIEMPLMNGEKATLEALKLNPDLKIIVLSMHNDYNYYQKMLNAGAKGFILKGSSLVELELAIKEVLKGNNFFAQELLLKIISQISIDAKTFNAASQNIELSDREIILIEMICQGLSNKEMSDKLFASLKTIESNKTALFQKLGVKNSIEMVVYVLKEKLIAL